jgi:hypothetical protein
MRSTGLLSATGQKLASGLCPNWRLDTMNPEIQGGARCVRVSAGAREGVFMLDLDTIFDPDRTPHAPPPASVALTPADLPADWHFAWDERAAIMEYEGGLHREQAEVEALKYILEDMRQAGIYPATVLANNRSSA